MVLLAVSSTGLHVGSSAQPGPSCEWVEDDAALHCVCTACTATCKITNECCGDVFNVTQVIGESVAVQRVNPDGDLTWGQQLELSCALTRQRLTAPARGKGCRHPANCNHDALRRHATSMIGRRDGAQPCPIIGCPEVLRRSGDVVRDETLAAKLDVVPAHIDQVWIRGGELRLDSPAASGGAASSSGAAAAANVDLT